MAITLVSISTIMKTRLNPLLEAAGLEAISQTDFADAASVALRSLGYSQADPTTPTNSELSAIDSSEVNQYFDLVELRLMETCLRRLRPKVTIALGPRRQELSDIADGLASDIESFRETVNSQYGSALGTLSTGVLDLNFAETNE